MTKKILVSFLVLSFGTLAIFSMVQPTFALNPTLNAGSSGNDCGPATTCAASVTPLTASDLLLVGVGVGYSSTCPTITVSDSFSYNYHLVGSQVNAHYGSNCVGSAVFYAIVSSTSAVTVTAHSSTSDDIAVSVVTVSNLPNPVVLASGSGTCVLGGSSCSTAGTLSSSIGSSNFGIVAFAEGAHDAGTSTGSCQSSWGNAYGGGQSQGILCATVPTNSFSSTMGICASSGCSSTEGGWAVAGAIVGSQNAVTTTQTSTAFVTSITGPSPNTFSYWFIPLIFILIPGGVFLGFSQLAKITGKWAVLMFLLGCTFGALMGVMANVVPAAALVLLILIFAVYVWRG